MLIGHEPTQVFLLVLSTIFVILMTGLGQTIFSSTDLWPTISFSEGVSHTGHL